MSFVALGKDGKQDRAAMIAYRLPMSCGLRGRGLVGKAMAARVLVLNASSFYIERRSFAA